MSCLQTQWKPSRRSVAYFLNLGPFLACYMPMGIMRIRQTLEREKISSKTHCYSVIVLTMHYHYPIKRNSLWFAVRLLLCVASFISLLILTPHWRCIAIIVMKRSARYRIVDARCVASDVENKPPVVKNSFDESPPLTWSPNKCALTDRVKTYVRAGFCLRKSGCPGGTFVWEA